MARIIVFNKPFKVLSQFSDRSSSTARVTLANFIKQRGYRVAGRLDYDSEGLLILTNDGVLQHQITNPQMKVWKTYLVQLEGIICNTALLKLKTGVSLKDGVTRPARVQAISHPKIWQRYPSIRYRKSVPTSWIRISIQEGRNRQIRRMTAQVGFPTLRLIRMKIGKLTLKSLQPGELYFDSIS